MKTSTEKWLYGLGSAIIGGGAAAVTSGLTSMGIAPDKFNMTNLAGVGHLLELIFVNFLVSGILSMFFFLRQSPLPEDTQIVTRTHVETVKTSDVNEPETKTVSDSVTATATTANLETKPVEPGK